MIEIRPLWFMVIGVGLMVLAVVLSVLMVMRILQPSFFLVFLTYGSSMGGILLGFIGIATLSGWRRR